MTNSRRVQRVEKELKQIIGSFLLNGLKTPVDGLVTITRVVVSGDLRTAKVLVTMMGSEEEKSTNIDLLQDQASHIQKEIHRQLPMKFCPKVKFEYDKGFDNVLLVEKRLQEIKNQKGD